MSGKILARDLYKILRLGLGDEMKALGFRRTKATSLGWNMAAGGDFVSLWFQVEKYGWFDDFGSSFTLEFQRGPDPSAGTSALSDRERFHRLLTPQQSEVVRALNNEVITSLPAPGPSSIFSMLAPEVQAAFLIPYKVAVTPYEPGRDVWMHYFTGRQAEGWAVFLQSAMSGMIDRFTANRRGVTLPAFST